MHNIVENLLSIKNEIQSNNSKAEIVAVSKTFPISKILPLINCGHVHYGENKIQEAVDKWTEIKKDFKNIKLHFVGKLQTNKVKFTLPLFDYIHSLDTLKLAEKIAKEQQKNGVDVENLEKFYSDCVKNFDLNIIGLMCLPPNDKTPEIYFTKMQSLVDKINLKELSMGMTNDYIKAIQCKSTFLRIGSKIFGSRN